MTVHLYLQELQLFELNIPSKSHRSAFVSLQIEGNNFCY